MFVLRKDVTILQEKHIDYNSTLENPVGDEKLLDEKSIPSVPLSQKILQSQETQTIKTGIYYIW